MGLDEYMNRETSLAEESFERLLTASAEAAEVYLTQRTSANARRVLETWDRALAHFNWMVRRECGKYPNIRGSAQLNADAEFEGGQFAIFAPGDGTYCYRDSMGVHEGGDSKEEALRCMWRYYPDRERRS